MVKQSSLLKLFKLETVINFPAFSYFAWVLEKHLYFLIAESEVYTLNDYDIKDIRAVHLQRKKCYMLSYVNISFGKITSKH